MAAQTAKLKETQHSVHQEQKVILRALSFAIDRIHSISRSCENSFQVHEKETYVILVGLHL